MCREKNDKVKRMCAAVLVIAEAVVVGGGRGRWVGGWREGFSFQAWLNAPAVNNAEKVFHSKASTRQHKDSLFREVRPIRTARHGSAF